MPRTAVADDFRTMDPVAYIRSIGLQPEDSYGFVPTRLDEGTTVLFLYRERPEYGAARPKLAAPEEATRLGPIRIEPTQQVEVEVEGDDLGAALDQAVAQAQQMQRTWGGPVSEPAPEGSTAGSTGAGSGGAPIVAHRLYPGIRMRSSSRQLNHFLPKYLEIVGLRPEDTYGVFPWSTKSNPGGEAGAGGFAWDDYWIIYRDRPEYEAAREAYAVQADKKGRWPEAVISPGVGDSPTTGLGDGKLEVEKEGWPRKALFRKETGPELAEGIEEKIAKFGYEPEDSYGFCPNFEHNRIYFGWLRR